MSVARVRPCFKYCKGEGQFYTTCNGMVKDCKRFRNLCDSFTTSWGKTSCTVSLPEQVTAASKNKAAKEKSEEVKAKTPQEKIEARLKDFLKVSGQVRTGAISIKELDFAKDLSKKMLDHASAMETTYHAVAKLAKLKSPERALKEGEPRMEDLEKKSAKLQASTRQRHFWDLGCPPCQV